MWPSRIGDRVSSYPCQCTTEQFDESKVSDSLSEMESHWPSYNNDNDKFWGHEWTKHGTCCDASGANTQSTFFASAINLRAKSALLAGFAASDITPGKSYDASSMAAAIKKSLGVTPTLGCDEQNNLSEVGLCYSKSLEPQECDTSVTHQQGDEVSDCDTTKQIAFMAPN